MDIMVFDSIEMLLAHTMPRPADASLGQTKSQEMAKDIPIR